MSILSKAREIYSTQGCEQLLLRCIDFAQWKFKESIKNIFDIYWGFGRQALELKVGESRAEFHSGSDKGGPSIRRHFHLEHEMLEDLVDHLDEDDVFYDIGANLGIYSIFASGLCAEVVAFEPHPKNFELLVENIDLNASDVDPHQLAISDEDGEELFVAGSETTTFGSGGLGDGDVTVETARIDSLISSGVITEPDVVKIDVEGAEGLVLDGMSDALSACRRVYCEIHLPSGHRRSIESYSSSPTEILLQLSNAGFETNIAGCRGQELQVIAEK